MVSIDRHLTISVESDCSPASIVKNQLLVARQSDKGYILLEIDSVAASSRRDSISERAWACAS
jgi:hypothetical protein